MIPSFILSSPLNSRYTTFKAINFLLEYAEGHVVEYELKHATIKRHSNARRNTWEEDIRCKRQKYGKIKTWNN